MCPITDEPKLIDFSDTHVLEFELNLKQMALMSVIKNNLDTSVLPHALQYVFFLFPFDHPFFAVCESIFEVRHNLVSKHSLSLYTVITIIAFVIFRRWDIRMMTTANNISRPLNNTG